MANLIRSIPEKILYFLSMLLSRAINRNKDLKSIPVKEILCIRLDEIGDMCYTTHVFRMLALQYPEAQITLLCKPFVQSLVKYDPHINSIHSSFDELKKKYDLVVDLRETRSSLLWALKHWPAIRLERGSVRYRNMRKGKHPHEVITNLQLIEPIIDLENQTTEPGLFHNPDSVKKVDLYLEENKIEKFAVLHPGARKMLRRWDKFGELAVWLHNQKGLTVLITGDQSEIEAINQLMEKIRVPAISVAGVFDLSELSVLLSKASLFVGNESGPLHIASVAGTPSLGLFGPGEPYVFYPRGKKTDLIHYVLECNPCDQIHCVHPDNPCIGRIQVPEVTEKLEKLMF